MRLRLLEHIVCPSCRGKLDCAPLQQTSTDEIQEGKLICRVCQTNYPIRRGIPRFPLSDLPTIQKATMRTQSTYSFTWNRFGLDEVKQQWEKDSYRFMKFLPEEALSGSSKLGLDAGCGGGADLVRIAERGAELIGVDCSEGVDIARQMTRHFPNVHLVQADLHRLPFRPNTFDFIYSFGVLHHLPDPQQGTQGLSTLLKKRSPLVTYLYEDFSDRSWFERVLLHAVSVFRKATSSCPSLLLLAICWIMVPFVWLTCSVPAHILGKRWPHLAGRIPFRHTLRWQVLVSDLFDRFAPPLEWRFSRAGVAKLYQRAGLVDIEIRPYRGWVSWGFRP